ncbi:MAG: cellulase family glycosylhydrolase [Verrucomicrobia bacterium]|nr:cellulase family glycosylhydrolase [Verrucomicrobiota bacterium]MCH8528020.1 cellulase family glycosylhydrolase [Kiritimatiellia bacterium]
MPDSLKRGFLQTRGTEIVDEHGESVLLRGVNLGNWFLPEAYMWKFPKELGTARKMEAVFEELLGPEKAAVFWETFYDRYTAEADIRQIAKEGFNSIRLPLNYRLFMSDEGVWSESRMKRIDAMLDLCEDAGLYVILDLHGAPGGQTGTNIDDSPGYPHLFTDPENVERTVHFWRTIALRYRDRAVVGGYDLLNEPVPREHRQFNDALIDIYKRLIAAIREVDTRHMVILECAHWATDFRIFTEKSDDNMVVQFHKYWCPTDYRFVRDYLNLRETLNVPLWMGESGENSLDWYTASFQMLEDHNISWCFWPWKKMDTLNTPCSVKVPRDWEKLSLHARGEMELTPAEAEPILWEFLENIRFENCEYHAEVVCAMMRRVPFRIPAEAYEMKGVGRSYFFTDKVCASVNIRREEGADIQFVFPRDDELPDYGNKRKSHTKPEQALSLGLQSGDWVKYELHGGEDGPKAFDLTAHLHSGGTGTEFELWLDDRIQLPVALPPETGWRERTLARGVVIPPGRHCLKLVMKRGSLRLDWLEWLKP